ncbi:MAG: glycosyl transferase family 2 [Frankiales bacterium]|nr:glycosyl transferase family 2 [Frankiales bacterium]
MTTTLKHPVPDRTSNRLLSVSVVVCTYADRRWDQLLALVEALRPEQVDQVILVVDHHPALLARARAAFPHLLVLPNAAERGLSGARNTGVAAALHDVVLFVDDDARPRPGFVAQLLEAYDDSTIGVGGRAEPEWESARPAWFPRCFDWVIGCSHEGLPEERAPLRNVIGAAMSFRRSVLATHSFDSSLGRVGRGAAGCEETELCLRISQVRPGTQIVYEPRAVVDHLVPRDRATLRYFARRCWAEGVSKARVARLAGPAAATSAERSYVLRVLPRAFVQALLCLLTAQPARAAAAPTILLGLTLTLLGYGAGRVRR